MLTDFLIKELRSPIMLCVLFGYSRLCQHHVYNFVNTRKYGNYLVLSIDSFVSFSELTSALMFLKILKIKNKTKYMAADIKF